MANEKPRKGSIWAKHKFAAFISYSRADKAVGELFQSKLERYKIPKPLVARTTLNGPVPKRLVPIFRDITDLGASGDLGGQINKALDNSAFLILLCSPHSAASKWVNAEIAHFKRKGAGDRIIPVILDGEPVEHHPVNAPNGAFPPALMRVLDPDGELTETRAPEPLAPDMRPRAEGPDYAVLKTVAAMIGLEPDILSQRRAEMERRDRRRLRRIATVISVLAIAATGAAIAAYTQLISARESQSRAFASLAWANISEGQYDRAARLALQAIPAGKGIALQTDARDGEDAMQAALWANHTLGRLASEPGGSTYQIAEMSLSEDASTAAVIDTVGGLRVVDLEAGRVTMDAPSLARFAQSDMFSTYSAALSPDGTQLVTFALSPWTVQFDEAACGLSLDREAYEDPWYTTPATIWDTAAGCPVDYLSPETASAFRGGEFAWSPTGETMIVASWANRSANVYALPRKDLLFTLAINPAADPGAVEGWREPMPAYSGDGALILTKTGPFSAGLVSVENGRQVRAFNVPQTTGEEWVDGVDRIAFTGDETAVRLTVRDGRILYFDAANGQLMRPPDLPVLREEGFDDGAGNWVRELRSYAGPTSDTPDWRLSASAHGISDDGTMLVTFERELGAVRDLATGEPLLELAGHTAPVTRVLPLPEKNLVLTGAENGEVRLWDVAPRAAIGQLSDARVHAALGPGRVLISDARRSVLEAAGADGEVVWSVALDSALERASYSGATGQVIALETSGRALLINAETGVVRATADDVKTLGQPAVSCDGNAFVYISSDGQIRVAGADGAVGGAIPKPGDWAWKSAALSADGTRVFAAQARRVSAFDVATGAELWAFQGFPDTRSVPVGDAEPELRIDISHMQASPDGSRLLVFFDNSPRAEYIADHGILIDGETGAAAVRLALGNYEILEAAQFTATGDMLVTGSSAWIGDSPDLRAWDPATGELLAFVTSVDDSMAPQSDGLDYIWTLSPSGERVLSRADTGELRLWAARSGRLIADLTSSVPPGLEIEALALGDGRAWLTGADDTVTVVTTPAETRGRDLSAQACDAMADAGILGFSTDELAQTNIPQSRRAPCETLGLYSPRLIPDMIGRAIARLTGP